MSEVSRNANAYTLQAENSATYCTPRSHPGETPTAGPRCGRRDRLLVQSSAHRHAMERRTIKHRHRTPQSLNTRAGGSRRASLKLRTRPFCKSTVRPTAPVTTLWTRVMSRMRSVGRVWVEPQSIEDARRSRCRYSPITTGSSTTCVQTQPTLRISTFSPRCSLQCSSSCAGSRSSQIVATIRDATSPLPIIRKSFNEKKSAAWRKI